MSGAATLRREVGSEWPADLLPSEDGALEGQTPVAGAMQEGLDPITRTLSEFDKPAAEGSPAERPRQPPPPREALTEPVRPPPSAAGSGADGALDAPAAMAALTAQALREPGRDAAGPGRGGFPVAELLRLLAAMEDRLAAISQEQLAQNARLRQELDEVAAALARRIEASDSKVETLASRVDRGERAVDERLRSLEGQMRHAVQQLRERVDTAVGSMEAREAGLRRNLDDQFAQSEVVHRQRLDRWMEALKAQLMSRARPPQAEAVPVAPAPIAPAQFAEPQFAQAPRTPPPARLAAETWTAAPPPPAAAPSVRPPPVAAPATTRAAGPHPFADQATPLTATIQELDAGARISATPPPRRVGQTERVLLLAGGVSALALGALGFSAWERRQMNAEGVVPPPPAVSPTPLPRALPPIAPPIPAAPGTPAGPDLRPVLPPQDSVAVASPADAPPVLRRGPERSTPRPVATAEVDDPAWQGLRDAAQQGDPAAMHDLGLHYLGGKSPNPGLAAKWFRAAADQGFGASQYNLARLYEAGAGVPRDLSAAVRLYRQAAAQGDTAAKARADALEAQLARRGGAAQAAGGGRTSHLTPGAILDAQRTLSRLGYYVGPIDGQDSEALQGAISRYASDAGMAPQVVPGN